MKEFEILEFRDVSFQVLITGLRVREEGKEDTIVIRGIDKVSAVLGSVSVEHNLCIIVQLDEPISEGMLRKKLCDWTKILGQRNNVWSVQLDRLPDSENFCSDYYYRVDAYGHIKGDRYEIKMRIASNV